MCTPRLVRWRLRDWASCFLPLDDDDTARPPRVTPRNIMGFDNKRSDINPIYDNKSSRPRKKRNHNTQISDRMDRIQKHNKDRVDDSALSFSADEDYIVFCFREDGAFDVMQDGNKSSDGNPTNHSRPVNRKLNYGEDAEQVWKQRNPNRHKEEEEKVSEGEGEGEERSSDSNQSEGSAGSFAFPVLGWEWIGSPVQLPKSEALHLTNHKVRSLRFQCCKF